MPRLSLPCLVLPLLGIGLAPASAQEPDEDEPFLPGLVATLTSQQQTVSRIDPQLAHDWGDRSPDPRLGNPEFSAIWRGQVRIEGRGEHRLFLHGRGEMSLKLDDRVLIPPRTVRDEWCESPPVSLPVGQHALEVTFRRTESNARLAVFWSGPQFGREPIPPRLLTHARTLTVSREFERGQLLARTLRCGHCHPGDAPPPPGPALDHLGGRMNRAWLIDWLQAHESTPPKVGERGEPASPRRMPTFDLTKADAETLADWLLTPREPPLPPLPTPPPRPKDPRKPAPPSPSATKGERLLVTRGCLACHTWRDLGASGWLGGGDLTHIGDKRPREFFAAWLDDPTRLNRDHRMPVFSLSAEERTSLSLFLGEQKSSKASTPSAIARAEGGRQVAEQFRCVACHRLPDNGKPPQPAAPTLGPASRWQSSCLGKPNPQKRQPGYHLGEADARALKAYYGSRRTGVAVAAGHLLLAEHNCFACHGREGAREATPLLPPALADKLVAVGKRYPDLAPLLPALTPPSLNSIGDKLTEETLRRTLARQGEPLRPYLEVQMPRFPLGESEMRDLVQHLIAIDRIPSGPVSTSPDPKKSDLFTLAGGRLVSSDGFGCTSCHALGKAQPSETRINVRGPDLSLLGQRLRREWYDRWVRNPARIVPRMEMPSVQLPIQGVLGDQIDDQLAAVWHVLNRPGFDPPAPNPVRILRHHGHDPHAAPVVVTDLVHVGPKSYLRPFLVGLANRHNVLFDFQSGALAHWTVGDTARQRTRGKNWLWESGGLPVLDTGLTGGDIILLRGDQRLTPKRRGQFLADAETWGTEGTRFVLTYTLSFGDADRRTVTRTFTPISGGFRQEIHLEPLGDGERLRLDVLAQGVAARASVTGDGREVRFKDRFAASLLLREPASARFVADGTSLTLSAGKSGSGRIVLDYLSDMPVDRLPQIKEPSFVARKGLPVEIAPGFTGERLPLPYDIMPTGLAWRPEGKLVFCTLKGQVYEAQDTDGDGSEDQTTLLVDGLPSPYGIAAGPGYVDVAAKYALLRLPTLPRPGTQVRTVAAGWGYTTDYHDWAIGLPRNARGEYFLGIPCQQDKRTEEEARFHGQVLRLRPRPASADNPYLFSLESLSQGHRFPTGLALHRDGDLFVTDNQGNYNPFNELNHVRPGAHFGFINTRDRGKPVPPLTPPAIDIPHPWTRSVNGICFLDTPASLRTRTGRNHFGLLEGHLIGCEYDTRRLVRMTLQKVGDTYQGAAYPLSIPPENPTNGLLGPIVCAVSPRGALYVGGIRDSGWGAGNNVGEVVRIRIEPDRLPCGVAEVRAVADGFDIDFFQPVDRTRAAQAANYTIESYRRIATPAYGGPDVDRRTEKVTGLDLSPDGRRVRVRLAELRAGFVYELRFGNLAPGGSELHPAEAHYTMRVIPGR